MTGHTTERCYKLHGYPPGHKLHKPKSNGATVNQVIGQIDNDATEDVEGTISLTKGQYQDLLALLKTKDPLTASHSANHIQTLKHSHPPAMSGISQCLSALNTHHPSHIPWIIDMGAIDHMVCSTFFFTFDVNAIPYSVKMPNGEVASVTHIGTVQII